MRKRLRAWAPRERVTDQDGDKVDDVIRSEPWASKVDPFLDGVEHAEVGQCTSHDCHFAKPRGN